MKRLACSIFAAVGLAASALVPATSATAARISYVAGATARTVGSPQDEEFCYLDTAGFQVARWCDSVGAGYVQIEAYDAYQNPLGFVNLKSNGNGTRHLEVCDLANDGYNFTARIDPGTYPAFTYADAYGGSCKQGDRGYTMRKLRAELGDSISAWELAP